MLPLRGDVRLPADRRPRDPSCVGVWRERRTRRRRKRGKGSGGHQHSTPRYGMHESRRKRDQARHQGTVQKHAEHAARLVKWCRGTGGASGHWGRVSGACLEALTVKFGLFPNECRRPPPMSLMQLRYRNAATAVPQTGWCQSASISVLLWGRIIPRVIPHGVFIYLYMSSGHRAEHHRQASLGTDPADAEVRDRRGECRHGVRRRPDRAFQPLRRVGAPIGRTKPRCEAL